MAASSAAVVQLLPAVVCSPITAPAAASVDESPSRRSSPWSHQRRKRCGNPRGVFVVLGGAMIQMSLGSAYSFGNLLTYMVSYVHEYVNPDVGYNNILWVGACAMVAQGMFMPLGGIVAVHLGPRRACLLGSGIMSGGVALTSSSLNWGLVPLTITYGIMRGLGTAGTYAITLHCAMKWFPKHRGLVTGLVMAGLGVGALGSTLLQTVYLNPDNITPGPDGYFTNPAVLARVPKVFLIMSGIFLILQLLGCCMLCLPPEEGDQQHTVDECCSYGSGDDVINSSYRVCNNQKNCDDHRSSSELDKNSSNGEFGIIRENTYYGANDSNMDYGTSNRNRDYRTSKRSKDYGSIGDHTSCGHYCSGTSCVGGVPTGEETQPLIVWRRSPSDEIDVGPQQLLRRRLFYQLWLVFLCTGVSADYVSSSYKSFGQTFVADDFFLAEVGSFSAIFNAAGRLFWGVIMDATSFKLSMCLISCVLAGLTATLPLIEPLGRAGLAVWVWSIYFCFSGVFSVFPSTTAKAFGAKNSAVNYGIVFTAQVVAAPLVALLNQVLLPTLGYSGCYYIAAAVTFIGTVITVTCPRNL